MGAKYGNERACVNFTNFLYMPWLGPLLTAVQYVMYFRFCGWRHVFTLWSYGARIKDKDSSYV